MNHNDEKLLYFLSNKSEYITIDQLSDYMGLSRRTIYNSLNRIEDYLRKQNIKYKLYNKYSKGLKIEIDKSDKKDELINLIIIDIMSSKISTISEIMQEYNISYYSSTKYLNLIKSKFNNYNINISIKAKAGIILKYKIKDKYLLYRDILISNYSNEYFNKYYYKILSQSDVNKVNSILYVFSMKYSFEDDITNYIKANVYYISKVHLTESDTITNNSIYNIYSISLVKLMNLHYNLENLNAIVNFFIDVFQEINFRSYLKYNNDIVSNTNNLIRIIKKHFNYKEGEFLFKSKEKQSLLENHLFQMFSRIERNQVIENPIYDDIIKRQAFYFNELMNVSEEFSEYYSINIPLRELAYIVIYMLSFENDNENKEKAVIVSNYSIGINQYLKNTLESNLNWIDIKCVVNYDDFLKKSWKNFMVFSTMPLENKEYYKIPFIDNNLDILDLKKDIYVENKFINLFSKDLTEFDIVIMDKLKVLEHIANNLCSKGFVTDEYLDSLIKREKIESTEIGNKFSLVHGNPKFIVKSSLSFIRLIKPISWKIDNVQFIFVIAVKPEDYNKYDMKEFFKIVSILSQKDEICDIKSYEDLINLFFDYIL